MKIKKSRELLNSIQQEASNIVIVGDNAPQVFIGGRFTAENFKVGVIQTVENLRFNSGKIMQILLHRILALSSYSVVRLCKFVISYLFNMTFETIRTKYFLKAYNTQIHQIS